MKKETANETDKENICEGGYFLRLSTAIKIREAWQAYNKAKRPKQKENK